MSLDSLSTDVTSISGLDNKNAGDLIKPVDWGNLVQSVQGIGGALIEYIDQTDSRIGDLENLVTPLIAKVATLEQDLQNLQVEVQPLVKQYVVTMSTTKINYALGELCEITASVKDLSGRPVTTRPWVDFIASWGQMRVVPGFTSETGASGSSISVRCNNDGIAKVLVKSAHTENLTETQELHVATAMEATLPSGQFFYQAIMEAPTPSSDTVVQAFSLMTQQYQQVQSNPMQLFIDSYQQYPQFQLLPQWNPGIFTHWTKYRAIVVAFAKDDSDPRTPDEAKGSSSIQITFRDWVGPWIDGFVNDFEIFVPGIMGNIGSQIGSGGFALDLDLVHGAVANNIESLGIVGRQRYYNGVISAVDRLSIPTPPSYFSDLKQTVKNSVTLQQLQEAPALALKGNQIGRAPALAAMTGISKQAAAAKDVAESSLGSFEAIQATSKDLGDKIAAMDADLKATQQVSTAINSELSSIGQNVLRINTLDQDSVKGQINLITAQIGQINETIKRR